jgi:hypothetical protein
LHTKKEEVAPSLQPFESFEDGVEEVEESDLLEMIEETDSSKTSEEQSVQTPLISQTSKTAKKRLPKKVEFADSSFQAEKHKTSEKPKPFDQMIDKLAQARKLASDARELIAEAQELTVQLDSLEDQQTLLATLQELKTDENKKSLETSERREARKILDLARNLSEVEHNRLPSSTRKTLIRLSKDLDTHLLDSDGRLPMRLALQLANRLFEIIRRDLRSW